MNRLCKKIYEKLKNIHAKYFIKYDTRTTEHMKHFGKNFPDKIFYVIRRNPLGSGLLSIFHWVLNHTLYAILNGYIPVVNMADYKTHYNEIVPIDGTAVRFRQVKKEKTCISLFLVV